MNETERHLHENGASTKGSTPSIQERRTVAIPVSSPASTPAPAPVSSDISAGPARLPDQIDRAVAEFDREDPTVEMLMRNSAILEEAGDHRLAVNLLRNVLIRKPDDTAALERMGRCLREEGRYEEALKCFRALARTHKKIEAQIRIAEIHYLSERDELALASYREVLKGVVEDRELLFDIYKNIGNIHVRAGDFDAAEEFYDKAYTLVPQSDVLMVNYGTLEIQRENLSEAVARFRRAVELNSENDRAWVGLALVHRQMGDLELAWANVMRALDINKRNRTALRLIVEWGVKDQQADLSISRLQEYMDIDGEDAEMSFILAKLFTHAGRLSEARLEIERVLALDPGLQEAEALRVALDERLAESKSAREKTEKRAL